MQPTRAQGEFDCRYFLFGVFLLALALGTGEEPRGDPGVRLAITRQLLSHSRVHLADPHWGFIQTPSGWTSCFAIGQTLLFIPFEIVGKVLALLSPSALTLDVRHFPLEYLYCPLVGVAYFLALLSLLGVLGLSARAAAIASLLFTFCSLSAYYVAQSFQEEGIASVFVCLCLGAALRWQHSAEKRHAFAAGLWCASIFLFRYTAIFVLLPLGVLFVQGFHRMGLGSLRARQSAGAALLGALGPAAIYMLFAYLRFGNLFSTGYDHEVPVWDNVSYALWQPLQLEAVRSLLFGLGKGLFIFSPLLTIAFWGMWIDRARHALYGIACLAALAGSVIFSAFYFTPDGCWSWGTRYQVHLLPLFAYPAWVGMRDLLRRRVGVPIVAIALGCGLFFQLCGLLASMEVEYVQLRKNQVPIPTLVEVCRIVREHQFAMRLGNIASVIRVVGEGGEIMDPVLRRVFGHLWVLRLVRDHSGWARGAVIFAWLGIFVGAATCLYRALLLEGAGSKWVIRY